MIKVSRYYVGMNAYRAVVFVKNIQTNKLCHYVGEGSKTSGNVKLLGKKRVGLHETSHGKKENATHKSGPPPLSPTTS